MGFLDKLQNLPKRTRKLILWLVIATAGLCLLFLWGKGVKEAIRSFRGEEFIEQLELPDLPKIEIPKI